MDAWTQFLTKLEKDLSKEIVDHWLRPLRILNFDARNLYLDAKDSFQILWFYEHVASRAKNEFLTSNGTPITLHFYLKGKRFEGKKKEVPPSNPQNNFSQDHLEPHATFSQFITENNQNLPFNILANLVNSNSKNSDQNYNPIFIYGPKGCGKSHLLMATAKALTSQGLDVFYVKSETFTAHVIHAFRSGSLQEFRKSYRNIQALIIDDVHLLTRKTATQEELFHTFNRLHTAGLQIIISANCSPHLLEGIEERLVSRFEWGITLPLPTLSTSCKKQVLLSRAKDLSLLLTDPLIEFLFQTFLNLHSLIQALEALALRTHHTGKYLDIEIAKHLLKDLVEKEKANLLSKEKVLKIVADNFRIKTEDILGRSQSKECTLPRQISMYFCRKKLAMSYLKIGAFFSRDHSTVISSIKRIDKGLESKEENVLTPFQEISHHLS